MPRHKFTALQRAQLQTEAWNMCQKGLTQREIGERLGVSQPTVFYWLAAEKRRRAKEK